MTGSREERIIAEFRKRRTQALQTFIFSLIMFALGLVVRQVSDWWPGLFGMSRHVWSALATAQLIAGVVFAVQAFRQYRCPACNEIVRGHDKYYLGVIIHPDRCPHCGTRLL